jgi:hypothetical protein
MRTYRAYSDEDIICAVKEVSSLAGLLKKLGLKIAGGNYVNMKRNLQRLNLDCDHWQGQAWNKDCRMKDWSNYTQITSLKPHLIKERGRKCEKCNLTTWNDHKIPLEIHHKDGDRTNNNLKNLILLCPNCHALTKFYRGRNVKKK